MVNFYSIRKDEKKTCFQKVNRNMKSIFDSVKFCPWSKVSERKEYLERERQGEA